MTAPHDDLTHTYPRTLEEAFGPGERGPVVAPEGPPRHWRDTRGLWAVPVAVLVLTAVIGYDLMGRAFQKGYEQGYEQGYAEGNPRAVQSINQYCDRR